jgi:methylenetetrahydrofolate dehydrogenase (NADP+)/methenyltetrahydrofolate cyclohydrolase
VDILAAEYLLPENTTKQQLLKLINNLNKNKKIHGILLQLPLPKHLSDQNINNEILSAIAIHKDVDGFNPYNIGRLVQKTPTIRPCTPKGIIKLLEHYDIKIKSQNVTVVGASNIVGRPLALEMLIAGGTVTVCHKFTHNLKQHCVNADIICSAVGIPNLILADYIKPGATVVDIGITRLANGNLVGDVEYEQAKTVAKYITPVPGGVGPMTIAMLLENTIECFKLCES